MAQRNEREKSTQEQVRKIVKKEVSSFVSEIVQHYVKKRVIELKDTFSGKRIRRIEERSIKDVLKDRLDKRLSESINQVSNEIAKDGATWEDIGKGIEWALENGLEKYFRSISRLISLKTIVVSAVTLSILGGGVIFAAIFFHTLTVNISGEGTVDHSLDAQRYAHGTEVTVSAQPASGWEFDCWEGDVSSTSPILTVTMDRDKNITACFTRLYGFMLSINVVGLGSTDPPTGDCTYDAGTLVNVTARPASGWEFDCWEGDVSSTSPILTVTMDRDKNITACFTRLYGFMLSINVVGLGSTDPPTGDCTYDAGTLVNVTARPASGWEFDHWGGDALGTSPSITVTMTSDKNITAYFTKIKYTLSTSVSPLGSGSVSPSSGTYDAGTRVNITANPSIFWKFDQWSGTDNDKINPTTVTMTSNKPVTAYFTKFYSYNTQLILAGSGNYTIEGDLDVVKIAVISGASWDCAVVA